MTTKNNRRSGDARQQIIDAILTSRTTSHALKKQSDVNRFLAQYFADIPFEDLEGRSETVMARVALDQLAAGTDEEDFYRMKLNTARYYMGRMMPDTASLKRRAEAGAEVLMMPGDEAF